MNERTISYATRFSPCTVEGAVHRAVLDEEHVAQSSVPRMVQTADLLAKLCLMPLKDDARVVVTDLGKQMIVNERGCNYWAYVTEIVESDGKDAISVKELRSQLAKRLCVEMVYESRGGGDDIGEVYRDEQGVVVIAGAH